MNTRNFLLEHNIMTSGHVVLDCFCDICPDLSEYKNLKPSETVKKLWNKYKKCPYCNNNINGKIFELIITIILVNNNILPFYTNAKVHFVPGINYDILLYSDQEFPIVLSIKTSLRERWKQADLEALALKNVYRNAKSYLLTLDTKEVNARNKKRDEWLGLNEIIDCRSDKFDELIIKLAKGRYIIPERIEPVSSNSIVIFR